MLTPFGLNGFSIVQVLLSLYANFLPFALYAAWVAIALWDIGAQEKAGGRSRALWALVVLVVPLLGPIAYYAFGGSALSRRFRLALVVGAPVIYVALAALLLVLSGYVA